MLCVCYYPEHWPEADWAEDARRMVDLGIRYVRIGEFAWSRIEPERDLYDWGWLDRAVAYLREGSALVRKMDLHLELDEPTEDFRDEARESLEAFALGAFHEMRRTMPFDQLCEKRLGSQTQQRGRGVERHDLVGADLLEPSATLLG